MRVSLVAGLLLVLFAGGAQASRGGGATQRGVPGRAPKPSARTAVQSPNPSKVAKTPGTLRMSVARATTAPLTRSQAHRELHQLFQDHFADLGTDAMFVWTVPSRSSSGLSYVESLVDAYVANPEAFRQNFATKVDLTHVRASVQAQSIAQRMHGESRRASDARAERNHALYVGTHDGQDPPRTATGKSFTYPSGAGYEGAYP